MRPFAELAADPQASLDELALALAAEFREVDESAALAQLDRLGAELTVDDGADPVEALDALSGLLGRRHGFLGDSDEYDHPENSMLDRVLERRRGLPILLSVVYIEVARRAGVRLAGVGLPGHFLVGHFDHAPPLMIDPFAGGAAVKVDVSGEVRPWGAHETAVRMLNNVVRSYQRRGDLERAIRAAELRLELPLDPAEITALRTELRSLRARLN